MSSHGSPLSRGSRLGGFEIVAPLGAGGMGEVYRARDSRLGRDVAIKVLPQAMSSDPERLKRFEKEARAASALNHPNIVTIYETGSADGVPWIAMEHVEGETLRKVLVGGALPFKKLLNVATQIAEALARAHEAGIVHRDLKPENVMVTKDGLVKILDFGLAKLSGPLSGGSDKESQLPTVTGTSPGIVVGTVGYMSPEQASGEKVDFRSDQFAFGSMLYEMATGRPPFQRKTAVDTLSAILNEEPAPMASVAPRTPTPLRWIVERCLAKEPRGRFSATDDLARDLAGLRDHLSEATSSASLVATEGARRRNVPVPLAAAAALVVLSAIAGALGHRWLSSRAPSMLVPTLRRLTFQRGNVLSARYAPDGRTVVYTAAWEGKPPEVYTVRTDSPESRPVGLPMAQVCSVSSKGEIAVLLMGDHTVDGVGRLARVPIGGGTPREILDDVWGAAWAPNGEDLAVLRRGPSGERLLQYPIGTTLATGDINLGSLNGGGLLSPSGDQVAFLQGGSLTTVDRRGNRRVVSKGWPEGEAAFAWAPRGEGFVLEGTRSGAADALYAISSTGHERILVNQATGFTLHDVAADGRMLFEYTNATSGIASRAPGDKLERYYEGHDASLLYLSADGQSILFTDLTEPDQLFLRKTDGSPPVRLGRGPWLDFSPDARWVLVKGGPRELDLVPTGPGIVKKIPVENVDVGDAHILPGRSGFLLGVKSGESQDLYLLGPDGGEAAAVRVDGYSSFAAGPLISSDGSRILWETADGHVRIGSLKDGKSTLVPGPPLVIGRDFLDQWSADDRSLYVLITGQNGQPARIDLLDLATGERKAWKTLMPADPSGVIFVPSVVVSRDGQSYAYAYSRVLHSDLYEMEGVR